MMSVLLDTSPISVNDVSRPVKYRYFYLFHLSYTEIVEGSTALKHLYLIKLHETYKYA